MAVCYGPQLRHSSLHLWLTSCAQELFAFDFGTLIFLLYGVWKERNERIWSQKKGTSCDVILNSVSRLQEFRFHNLKETNGVSRRHKVVRWSAPPLGLLKINVDGSFNHVTGQGGVEFVIRNETGAMLVGGACPVYGLLSPEHGELLACKKALAFAIDHSFLPAIMEMDALNVQCQLMDATAPNTEKIV
ncbi:uncharacterized protein LOC112163764 [Rosa chinensis]|uniref:uncharacterized protein LOC112163764 n=1 Tax=Rosa chinensis TaxID=74649 RepID=UPI000D092A8E|nr:uncharacterized protein LOC112163764 [Rosa chinensis]